MIPAMPQSLSQVLLHIVFSTKERRPFLRDNPVRLELHRYLGSLAEHSGCHSHVVGGVEDHVHMLCALSRTITIAALVRELKRASSLWIKTRAKGYEGFAWQTGYGVFSVGYSQIDDVRRYIDSQEEHHRSVSFQDEFRTLLRRYNVTYDEAYVWD
jgi:putative transposase